MWEEIPESTSSWSVTVTHVWAFSADSIVPTKLKILFDLSENLLEELVSGAQQNRIVWTLSRGVGCIHAFVGEAAAVRILVVDNQSMWIHPDLLKEQFWLCGQRVLGVVTVDGGEKASKGLLRYTLLVWWCVHVCVYAPWSAPECVCVCVCELAFLQEFRLYSSWCVFRQTQIHPLRVLSASSVHNDIRPGSTVQFRLIYTL